MGSLAKMGAAFETMFDERLEQVLWAKMTDDSTHADFRFAVVTVAEGTSLDFALATIGRETLTAVEAPETWQELRDGDPVGTESPMCFQVVGEKTLVLGDWEGLKLYKLLCSQPRDEDFLAASARLNKRDHQVFALAKSMDKTRLALLAHAPASPGLELLMEQLPVFMDSSYIAMTLSLNEDPQLELTSRLAAANKQEGVTSVLQKLPGLLINIAEEMPTMPVTNAVLTSALENAVVTEPSEVESRLTISLDDVEPQLRPFIEAAIQKMNTREKLYDAYSQNNLRMIALGFHNFHEMHGFFPSVKTKLPGWKHPVSWRVAILPYIEEQQIYDQYNFDEPWNSEANKKLLTQMPQAYRHPSMKKGVSEASYVTIAGPNTATGDGAKPVKLTGYPDGTSMTMMVAETVARIPWTKPEDPNFDPKKPLRTLGGIYEKGFHIALADGSLLFIPAGISDATLNALISCNGGEQIDIDNLTGATAKERPTDTRENEERSNFREFSIQTTLPFDDVRSAIRTYYADKYPSFTAEQDDQTQTRRENEQRPQGSNSKQASPLIEVTNSLSDKASVHFAETTQLPNGEISVVKTELHHLDGGGCHIEVTQTIRAQRDVQFAANNQPIAKRELVSILDRLHTSLQEPVEITPEAFENMAANLVAGKKPNTEAARSANSEIALKAWPLVIKRLPKKLAQVIVDRTMPDAGIRFNDRLAKGGSPTEPLGWNVQAVHALALAHAGDVEAALSENDALLTKVTTNIVKGRLPDSPVEFLGQEHEPKMLRWLLTLQRGFIMKLSGRFEDFEVTMLRADQLAPSSGNTRADEAAVRQIIKAIAALPEKGECPATPD